jgi:hypothetical protein
MLNHMIEAVPKQFGGAPQQLRRRRSDEFKAHAVADALEPLIGQRTAVPIPIRGNIGYHFLTLSSSAIDWSLLWVNRRFEAWAYST